MNLYKSIINSKKIKSIMSFCFFIFYFVMDFIFIIFCIVSNLISYKKLYQKDTILISAADENYYKYLTQLLTNLDQFNFFSKIIIYDLGMSEEQVIFLEKNFKIEVRDFKFSKYPNFLQSRNVEHDNKLGSYAWKAVIIKEVATEFNKQVFWFDSANKIKVNFVLAKIALTNLGVFSTYSVGRIREWTYSSVVSDLKVNKKIAKKPNLNGAIIGFDINNRKGLEILNNWEELCLDKKLISPPGSSRENHRHDQSLLSIVTYEKKLKYYPKVEKFYGVEIHQWYDRIYYIQESQNNIFNELRLNWYREYGNISTKTFRNSKLIIFLDIDSLLNFPLHKLRNKQSFVNSKILLKPNLSLKNKLLIKLSNLKLVSTITENTKIKKGNIYFIDKNLESIENIKEHTFKFFENLTTFENE